MGYLYDLLAEARKANRMNPRRVRIIKDLPADAPDNYLHVDLHVGDILTKAMGPTYGCVNENQGIALTLSEDPYETPWGQINYEYWEDVE